MPVSEALDGEPADLSPTLTDDALATIQTHGDPIRSWARLLTPVVGEAKLRIDEDGLHVTAVDPANVFMVDLEAPAAGFEAFETSGEHVVGLNLARFQDAVKWARKRGDDGDPVAIEILDDPSRMRVTITREDQQMQRVSEWFNIDTKSIREEPNIPSLDLYNRATPDIDAFADAVDALDTNHDHTYLTRDGTDLLLASQAGGDTRPDEDVDSDLDSNPEDAVRLAATAWDARDEDAAEADSSIFSNGYLADIASALPAAKADRVTVKWGEQVPARFAFEHEDWGFSGHFMIAPRKTRETEADA